MKGLTMTLTFDRDTLEAIQRGAQENGFRKATGYIRWLVTRRLMTNTTKSSGRGVYELEIEDADEIEAYARAKRYGSVADFARIAMEQSISRHPLSEAQKARIGKSHGEGGNGL